MNPKTTPFPKRGTSGTERLGIATVSAAVHREPSDGGLGFIYRPLPDADKGVDGILETVDHGSAEKHVTGKLVGVQVKSGHSFFAHPSSDGWLVYIDKATVHYWREYSLPVILAVVDTAETVYWTLASDGDFAATKTKYKIPVPKIQRLDADAADAIAALAAQPPPAILAQLRLLVTELSDATAAQLDRHREDWRQGRRETARNWVDAMVSEPTRLAALEPSIAARVLRWAAAVVLDDHGDVDTARDLAEQARRRDPAADDARIQAGLALRSGDVNGVLGLLADSSEVSARVMQALIMCHVGNYSAAAALVPDPIPSAPIDAADTWRLRAFLRYAERDLAGAFNALSRADECLPNAAEVRLMRAVLMYLSALVPDAWPDNFPVWPQPIPAFFIRSGASASRDLALAATSFEDLLCLDWSPLQRRYIEAWRVAALHGIPSGRERAIEAAKETLASDPTQPYVLAWAARGDFPIDLQSHLDALEVELERTFEIEAALVYVAARVLSGRPSAVGEWLDRWRPRFDQAGAGPEWVLWRARAFVAVSDLLGARALLLELTDDRATALESEILHAEARATGDRSALWLFLESSAERTGNIQYTLEVCDEYARAGDWNAVIPHIGDLLHHLPTAYVRRLAISALYHTGDFVACLTLLDEALPLADTRSATLELQRMRAKVRLRTGEITGAIADIQSVIRASRAQPITSDLLVLARAQFLGGHTHEFAASARQARDRDDLTATDALQLCEVLAHDDSALARELWHIANARGVADLDVPTAVGLGFQLGLDADVGPLFARMTVLAASGHPAVQQFSIDELITKNQEWQTERARIWDLYRNAGIPTHGFAEFLNIPLVRLYRFSGGDGDARQIVRDKFALQLRDGSRALPPPSGVAALGRIAMDLSALILAAQLDILSDVEQQLAPIRLPQLTLVALREQRDKFKPHQPSRIDITYQLLAVYNRGRIRAWDGQLPALEPEHVKAAGNWPEWLALLTRARDEGAFVLDLPLDADPTVQSPHERPASLAGPTRLARLITVEDVRQVLANIGIVSTATEGAGNTPQVIRERSGRYQQGTDRVERNRAVQDYADALTEGATIYLTTAGAEALAADGLLEAAADVFTLWAEPADQQALRDQVDALRRMEKEAEWVDNLVHRVSDGIGDGRYILLPETRVVGTSANDRTETPASASGSTLDVEAGSVEDVILGEDAGVDAPRRDTARSAARRLPLTLQCLANLMSARPDTVDTVWVDDRWSNKFRFAGTARMTDLLEVLAALEASGRISVARRWQIYLQLRAENARIVPLSAEEILHHLRSARIVDGTIVESAALRTLRQYAAALLADASRLRVPPPSQLAIGDTGELEVVRSYASAVRGALMGLWQAAKSESDRANLIEVKAKSAWLVGNLYMDLAVLRSLAITAVPPETGVSAFDVALHLTAAFQMLTTNGTTADLSDDDSLAAVYADWVYNALAAKRVRLDVEFRGALIEHLRALFTDWTGLDAEDSVVRAIARMLARRTLAALPAELQDVLSADSSLMTRLGRTITSSVAVGPWHIATTEFANGVARLLRDESNANSEA